MKIRLSIFPVYPTDDLNSSCYNHYSYDNIKDVFVELLKDLHNSFSVVFNKDEFIEFYKKYSKDLHDCGYYYKINFI